VFRVSLVCDFLLQIFSRQLMPVEADYNIEGNCTAGGRIDSAHYRN
jgi:hypothetical protein